MKRERRKRICQEKSVDSLKKPFINKKNFFHSANALDKKTASGYHKLNYVVNNTRANEKNEFIHFFHSPLCYFILFSRNTGKDWEL